MTQQMQQRRDSAAAWTSVNPILAQGEIGVESNTNKFKIGDGATAWTALAYASGTVPDATTTMNGAVRLAGDLAGTAASPSVPGLATKAASDLSNVTPATGRSALQLGTSAVLNTGTGSNTVATGDDSRIVGALQKTSNLSDLGSLPTARTNLGIVADVQIFTSTGTWTKPAGATVVTVILLGPGGGGGSGRRGAAATVRCGGGGGGAGGRSFLTFPASALSATEGVVIGAVGQGGAAVTADDTSGNAGTNGSACQFGNHVKVAAGQAGGGGTASTGTAGGGGGGTISGSGGAAASTSGGVGVAGATSPTASGGGSGGGITSADSPSAGGNGGNGSAINLSPGSGGTVPGGAGGAGAADAANAGNGGLGGGGGAASITGAAGNGGVGGNYGGGGGGGGASLNGNASGAGANGGAGICIVISQ